MDCVFASLCVAVVAVGVWLEYVQYSIGLCCCCSCRCVAGVCAVFYRWDGAAWRDAVRAGGVRSGYHGLRTPLHSRCCHLGSLQRVWERRANRTSGEEYTDASSRSFSVISVVRKFEFHLWPIVGLTHPYPDSCSVNMMISSCFQPEPGAVVTPEQQKQIDAQTKRVVSLFKRQLAIPLLGTSTRLYM